MARTYTLIALALAAVGSAVLIAKPSKENDALAIAKAQVSLTQAIAAAESYHVGGKAIRADFESSKKDGWVYEVEVVVNTKVYDVKVDPQKGTVLSSVEDKQDSDHDERD